MHSVTLIVMLPPLRSAQPFCQRHSTPFGHFGDPAGQFRRISGMDFMNGGLLDKDGKYREKQQDESRNECRQRAGAAPSTP